MDRADQKRDNRQHINSDVQVARKFLYICVLFCSNDHDIDNLDVSVNADVYKRHYHYALVLFLLHHVVVFLSATFLLSPTIDLSCLKFFF